MKALLLAVAIAVTAISAHAQAPLPLWQRHVGNTPPLRSLTPDEAGKIGDSAKAKFLADMQKQAERQRVMMQHDNPATGNGCGGMGVVAIAEIEKAADDTMSQNLSVDYFQRLLESRMAPLRTEYFRDHMTKDSADLFITHDQDEKTIRECTPKFAKFIDGIRAKAAADKAAAEAEHARQVAEAQKPENKLFEAYWRFAFVQYCHKVREGYAMIYVSDPEFERAQLVAKAVERNATAADASLNTDAIWQRALSYNNKSQMPVNGEWCQITYNQLLHLSPVGVIDIEKP